MKSSFPFFLFLSVLLLGACSTPEIRILDADIRIGSFNGAPLGPCEGAGFVMRCLQGDVVVDGQAEISGGAISFKSSVIEQLHMDSTMSIYVKMNGQPVSPDCPMTVGQTIKVEGIKLTASDTEEGVFEIPLYVFKEITWQAEDYNWDKE